MKSVGVIGGSGYTGGELIRIILRHPNLRLKYVYSSTKSGKKIEDAHYDLIGESNLKFTDSINDDVDLLFLCLGHGNSKKFLEKNVLNPKTKVIDLSHDFRLNEFSKFKDRIFTYGLPEFQKSKLKNSNNIANPGCFATSIQLAILPLAYSKLICDEIHVNSITGSTGAGVGLSSTSHFSQRNNNLSWYKVFTHQHLSEINQTLNFLNGNEVKSTLSQLEVTLQEVFFQRLIRILMIVLTKHLICIVITIKVIRLLKFLKMKFS